MVAVTVVVPTHNRRAAVVRLLHALNRQEPIRGRFDAVVVCDGCTDGTASAIRVAPWAFPVLVLSQSTSGPAAARNAGARRASGRIFLFLDDDVEPLPNLLRAHAAFHERFSRGVAVGDLRPQIEARDFFGTLLRGWWLGMHEGPRERGHRYIFRDLLTSHFSIGREAFRELGGFDDALRCHEDWELGYRAIQAGLDLQFLPEAIAVHHDATTLEKTLGRKFDDGVADVQLIQRYPELVHDLPLGRPTDVDRLGRALRELAWRWPRTSDAVAGALRVALRGYEAARLRFRWCAMLENLLDHAYWRGVATAAGSPEVLRGMVERAPARESPSLTIDLARGIDAARGELDAKRPRSIRLVIAGEFVGDVPAVPGAERLRGEHLPRIIARQFEREYLRAASAAGVPATALSVAAPQPQTTERDAPSRVRAS